MPICYHGGRVGCSHGFYWQGKIDPASRTSIEKIVMILAFDGLVEQPVGGPLRSATPVNLSINAAIGTPFWSTGSLEVVEGADSYRAIPRSDQRLFLAGIFGLVAVQPMPPALLRLTAESRRRVCWRGPVRPIAGCALGYVARNHDGDQRSAGVTSQLENWCALVPPGKAPVSCSIELTTPGIAFSQVSSDGT